MVIITRDDYQKLFDLVKEESVKEQVEVLTMITGDCDAMCAHRIFACIMERLFVAFQTLVIEDGTALLAEMESIKSKQVKSTVILFNFGSVMDLPAYIDSVVTRIIVIDSTRPVNLNNVFHEDIYVLVDDATQKEILDIAPILRGDAPKKKRAKRSRPQRPTKRPRLTPPDSDSPPQASLTTITDSPEDTDSFDLFAADPAPHGEHRDSEDDAGEEGEEDEEDEEDEEEEEDALDIEEDDEINLELFHRYPKAVREQIKVRKETEYYRNVYWAQASSLVMYESAEVYRCDARAGVLWMACVGFTAHCAYNRCNEDKFDDYSKVVSRAIHDQNYGRKFTVEYEKCAVKTFEHGSIAIKDEYKAPMLRRWTLYDSIYHSMYFSSRLQLYCTDDGKQKIRTLFSKVGIDIASSKARVTSLDSHSQSRFRDGLERFGREFGLRDYTAKGYVKTHGYNMEVSAADLVDAVNAMISYFPEKGADPRVDYMERVWLAYRMLPSDTPKSIANGMDLAVDMYKVLVNQIESILQRDLVINNSPHFRYVLINDNVRDNDLHIIGSPCVLRMFAYMLAEACKAYLKATQSKQRRDQEPLRNYERRKPLIVAVLNPAGGRGTKGDIGKSAWLVTGIEPFLKGARSNKSSFGTLFRQVFAERHSLEGEADVLDPSYVWVNSDSIEAFLNGLHSLQTSRAQQQRELRARRGR